PVSGKTVTFTVASGGGSITSGSATTDASGIATVGSWTLGATVGANTLTATTTAVNTTSVTLAATATAGAAAKLAFTGQPTTVVAGAYFSPGLRVTVQDASGNTVSTSTATVALSVASGPTGGTVQCTQNSKSASSGAVTFLACVTTVAGTYTLSAASAGLTSATSGTVTVSAGTPHKLVTNAGNNQTAPAGTAVATAPSVLITDSYNNPVAGFIVTYSVVQGGGSVTGATAYTDASGIAAVGAWTLGSAIGTNLVNAKALALTVSGRDTTAVFTATASAGAASKLAFTTSMGGVVSMAGQSPVVKVQDASGNTVTSSSVSVTLTIASTTAAGTPTLACSANPVTAVNGVATFSGCKMDLVGSYTVKATANGLADAVTSSFTISTGLETKLVFAEQPVSGTGGSSVATSFVAQFRDAGNNPVTGSSQTLVQLVLSSGPSGGTLSCSPKSMVSVGGVATFASCIFTTAGTYVLATQTSMVPGFGQATSAPITITTGPAAKLAFTTQPSGGNAKSPWSSQPAVTVQDAGGNTVTTSGAAISLAFSQSGAPGLSCTSNPTAASSGVATFSGCLAHQAGASTLTLIASSGALTPAT
ncbi:MAG: hypothetical protein NTW72_02345, partial [Gemmatimonadetes bacterium]|nr:hypothetical protein [Gemmatimonadota bacterium]